MKKEKLPYERIISVCCNQRDDGRDCCNNSGASEIREKLKSVVKKHGIQNKIRVCKSGCLGKCSTGVNVMIHPDNIWIKNTTTSDTDEIIQLYIDAKV